MSSLASDEMAYGAEGNSYWLSRIRLEKQYVEYEEATAAGGALTCKWS